MKRFGSVGLLLFVTMCLASEAMAGSAASAARSSARKRGYTAEQTRCFVPIFVSYAARDRRGKWIAGSRSKRGDIYRHEVYAKCGVIR